MSNSVDMKLEGDAVKALLSELPRRVGTKANKAAVQAAARPIAKSAKSKAPRQSNLLRKAIGVKVTTFKSDAATIAVGKIGARRDVQGEYKGVKHVPARYIHLVEKDTRHTKGTHFLENAYQEQRGAAESAAAAKFTEVIEKEAARLGAK